MAYYQDMIFFVSAQMLLRRSALASQTLILDNCWKTQGQPSEAQKLVHL